MGLHVTLDETGISSTSEDIKIRLIAAHLSEEDLYTSNLIDMALCHFSRNFKLSSKEDLTCLTKVSTTTGT